MSCKTIAMFCFCNLLVNTILNPILQSKIKQVGNIAFILLLSLLFGLAKQTAIRHEMFSQLKLDLTINFSTFTIFNMRYFFFVSDRDSYVAILLLIGSQGYLLGHLAGSDPVKRIAFQLAVSWMARSS